MAAAGGRMAATLLLLLAAAAAGARLGELARRETGDIFTILGNECSAALCAEHGAGARAADAGGECACVCPQRAPLFREDRELCVDDLPECSLATFGTGSAVQRIPFVYLPLKGQIIHPSREITFQNVKTPICAVSGAQFLTRKGFLDLRNTLDADVPFNLFRDEGRTFLQWSGENDVRTRMTGRVMVVRLLCRDVAATPTSPLDLRGVFTPCVAFRVQGTPPKPHSNVTEVQFAPNAQTSETTNTSGLTVSEYVAIGISSLLLGLIYVASVFLFLHIRKRRKAMSDEDGSRKPKGLKKKDGSVITERDIIRVNNERIQSIPNTIGQDDGILKNNPLLSINRQLHESKHFPNDSGSHISDSDDFGDSSVLSEDNLYTNQSTSAVIHQHYGNFKIKHENFEFSHRDESGIERLPDEHVSIVDTQDDREIARPVGTTRRKLYFNPAYFEPQLMAEPPAAALEFLVKIREVIAIAKHKMSAKRFQPILNQIPEEETYPSNGNSIDIYQGMGSQRSGSMVSLKRENSRNKNCIGCPGCKVGGDNDMQQIAKYNIPTCANCLGNKGDKQNSIRKWLENVPTAKQHQLCTEFLPKNQLNLVESLLSLPSSECGGKLRKQNSFSSSNSMYLTDDHSVPKKNTTLSVRSEPMTRNYNLPLPDFENSDCQHNDFTYYCQTVARVDDIRPIGLADNRSANIENNIENPRIVTSFTNKNILPDMVNEAIALDHCTKSYNQSSSDEERLSNKNPVIHPNLYTINNSESLSGNDYETDSLERTSNKKDLSTPTDYPDVPSSQASPSLSNALPLEEELTMRNAVYKVHSNSNTPSPHQEVCIDQNHYETIGKNKTPPFKAPKASLVSEVYVNNTYNFGSTPTSPSGSDCSLGSRKLVTTVNDTEEKPGCLTIEVKDPPENYIKIHESDDFEPDTLDRKHLKHKESDEHIQFSRKNLLKNIGNDDSPPSQQRIQLRSSGTFIKTPEKNEYTSKFNSLRNEYEHHRNINERPKLSPEVYSGSKSLEDTTAETLQEAGEWTTEEGRILTLELRHSKRQRQSTPPTIKQLKNLARPDVLPPLPAADDDPIYEQPIFPPRRVETDRVPIGEILTTNDSGRSLSPRSFTNNMINESSLHSSNTPKSHCGLSCIPMKTSDQSQSSEYENLNTVKKPSDSSRNFARKQSGRSNSINTATFVKGTKSDGHTKSRFRRKKGSYMQDSGYLSSDSTSSRQVQRKLVIAKIVSCSESDDTENEACSESGAESVETHSVYFDSFRQMQTDAEDNVSYNSKSVKDVNGKFKHSDDCL